MSFRKTGSVTGEVTGVEQPDGALAKEAAREPGRAWNSADEAALEGENQVADRAVYTPPVPEGFQVAEGARTVTLH